MKKANPEMQRLLWIIDFVNQDIDNMPRADFVKLFIEMEERLKPRMEQKLIGWKEIDLALVKSVVLGRLKGDLPPGSEKQLWGEKTKPIDLDDESFLSLLRNRAKEIQKIVKNVFDKIYDMKTFSEVDKRDKPPICENIFLFKATFSVEGGHGLIHVGPERFKQALEYEISDLIYRCSPVEQTQYGSLFHRLDNFKKCKNSGCQRYFWQVHKKEKNYCSNQCAWVAYSRFRREEEKKDRAKKRKEA